MKNALFCFFEELVYMSLMIIENGIPDILICIQKYLQPCYEFIVGVLASTVA